MGDPQTLIDLIRALSRTNDRGFTFLTPAEGHSDLVPHEWSFAQLCTEAERRGRYFRSLGLRPGDRLAMIVPDGEDFVLSFFGAVMAGVVPVPMYPPLALGKLDSYADSAQRILTTSGARMLLTSKQVSPILWSLVGRVPTLEDIVLTEKVRDHDNASVSATLDDVRIVAEDPCFFQFTSGSTSDPKGVVVSHGNLVANARAIMVDGLHSDANDRGVSWLPLYHDMGLIGFVIAPLANGTPVVYIPTLSFVKRPSLWLETVSKYRGTITFAPNFAFGLASKRVTPKMRETLDLSCIRVLGCGAEPINASTMQTFVDAFTPLGFNANALMPCYGMAEATLAIAFDDLSRPITTVRIDREAYESEKKVKRSQSTGKDAFELVSCGRTFSEHEVAIMAEDSSLLPEGSVGEIVVRGPSVTQGYYQNEEASKALLAGGWLHTGDLGFMVDGDLYISGRMKDLIILNGRNYYPQAIEWEVEQVEGIRRGNAVAFAVRGDSTEELVVIAETKHAEKDVLAAAVKRRIQSNLGLVAKEIVLVGTGDLPKTSSGKLQRRKTKQQWESGELGRVGSRLAGSTAAKVTVFKHITFSAFARIRHTIRSSFSLRADKKITGVVTRTPGVESR